MIRPFSIAVLIVGLSTACFEPAGAAGLAEPTAAAQDALATICLPATEKSLAPRDLATQQGFTPDVTPPAYVQRVFPMAQIGSASFSKPIDGGTLHVVSTVAPPPSNPFSCLIALDVDAPGLVDSVKARFSGAGTRYVYLPAATKGAAGEKTYVIALDANDPGAKTDDKIMAFSADGQGPDQMHAFLLTYRVDVASYSAAQELKQLCADGKAPTQMCGK